MLYPEQTATRFVESLDGMWKFKSETTTVDPNKGLCDYQWMAVPASFNDQTLDKKLRDKIGYFWYETNFNVPSSQLRQRNVLYFGGVSQNVTVYVNGDKLGNHVGGYTPFEFDVTDFVHGGLNNLKLRVDNLLDASTLPSSDLNEKNGKYDLKTRFDFYNYLGVNRPVKLYTTGNTYLEHIAVNYTINGEDTIVTPDLRILGSYDHLCYKILDQEGNQIVSKDSAPLVINNAHRWEPGKGYLYQLVVDVFDIDNNLIDTYSKEFGIRTIVVKNNTFLINGRPFYFTGFGRHEDSLAHGKGINLPQTNLDFQIMKWMGANSLRTSHYPYSEEAIRQADREGIVVIEEVPAVGLFENFHVNLAQKETNGSTWRHLTTMKNHKLALKEMIERDHDSPSVVMWSVANEPASHEDGAYDYFKEIIDYTKGLDPQERPVTIANIFMAKANNDKVAKLLDVICLNRYYGWYIDFDDFDKAKDDLSVELNEWHTKYPDTPILMTEFGADTIDGVHSLLHQPYSEEFQTDFYKAVFEIFDQYDYVIGEQLWTFADFATSPTMIRANSQNNKGIFTRDRRPKNVVQFLKNRWIHIKNK